MNAPVSMLGGKGGTVALVVLAVLVCLVLANTNSDSKPVNK